MIRRAVGAGPLCTWRHTGPRMPRLAMALIVLLRATLVIASAGPTVLLHGAGLDEARQLAIDSALDRGWRLDSAAREAVTFEQTLEDSSELEAAGPRRVIRVTARFTTEGAGVRVQLGAEEVESPGQPGQSSTDVTDRYSLNLSNALSSLRVRWDNRQAGSPTWEPGASDGRASVPPSWDRAWDRLIDRRGVSGPVGTWAYSAEHFAQDRGCMLANGGARLESAGADWEWHRVPCQDGSWMRVYCRFGDCTSAAPER